MAIKHFKVYRNILNKLIVAITVLAVLVLAHAFGILTGTKVVIQDAGIQPSALVLAMQTDQVDVIVSTLFAFVGAMVVLGLLYWIGTRIPKGRSDLP